MTLPTGRIGDKGQRYRVTYTDWEGNEKPYGWCETMEHAQRMLETIAMWPSAKSGVIYDRKPNTLQN